MTLTLGFSPCPNDTFIFDALVNNKIDTEGIIFSPVLEDVQTLNEWALERRLQITKLSYGVLPLVLKDYVLLISGSALGRGVGPLLISNSIQDPNDFGDQPIAIPGENTTAHLLFSLSYPQHINKIFLRYNEIEDFVLAGKGLGVIIHENRFTYQAKGLHKVNDLGSYWEHETKMPIPLGGIVIDRRLDSALSKKVEKLIIKSIEFAYSNYPHLNDYIKLHAIEMSEVVMRQHIDLYVNDFSKNLGVNGRNAVLRLLDVHQKMTGKQMNTTTVFL